MKGSFDAVALSVVFGGLGLQGEEVFFKKKNCGSGGAFCFLGVFFFPVKAQLTPGGAAQFWGCLRLIPPSAEACFVSSRNKKLGKISWSGKM